MLPSRLKGTKTINIANVRKPAIIKIGFFLKKSVIKKAKAKKGKKATVTWKKQSGVVGYQIVYSTSKKFTKKTTKRVTAKVNKKVLKKLKAGKRYYVKVRACTLVKNPATGKNVRVYGKYSKVKKFKAKR